MEKKIKFSDNPKFAKTLYGVVIAVLCITAIVIGIVAANNRDVVETPDDPTIGGTNQDGGSDTGSGEQTPGDTDKEPQKLSFISPVVGTVVKEHNLSVPVFSTTLEEWRIHTGIDISTPEGASVFAAEAGEVTNIYNDPLLGYTVEITHSEDIKTLYSNLDPESSSGVRIGDTVASGDIIGIVGDSSISELAEEPHLHLSFIVDGNKVNPLDYISDEAKKVSLGMEIENEA